MGYYMFGEETKSQFTLNMPNNLVASKLAVWTTVSCDLAFNSIFKFLSHFSNFCILFFCRLSIPLQNILYMIVYLYVQISLAFSFCIFHLNVRKEYELSRP